MPDGRRSTDGNSSSWDRLPCVNGSIFGPLSPSGSARAAGEALPARLEDADGVYRPLTPDEGSDVVTVTIAHRGDPVGHRENTLEAFQSAIMMGAAMIELDCRLTRDRRVVVLHDSTLMRLWAVPKPVVEVEWDVVRTIRSGGYRIPDLAEVLAAVEVPIMVDVPSVEVLEASLAVVEGAQATERCVFAGNTEALRRLRQLAPSARIALTWDHRHLPEQGLLTETRPEWFNPYWRLVTPAVVEQMHESGLGVSVWTVDGPADIREGPGPGRRCRDFQPGRTPGGGGTPNKAPARQ